MFQNMENGTKNIQNLLDYDIKYSHEQVINQYLSGNTTETELSESFGIFNSQT